MPVGNDVSAFEDTLVSVLENQPVGSEILVAHDGNYDDPFDLDGEVRFVVDNSTQPVDLIAKAAMVARGRFVHVLTPGMLATAEWADEALGHFAESDVASVAAVVQNDQVIVAAGWFDKATLCQPLAVGAKGVDRHDERAIEGAYLNASFWRRDLLCSFFQSFDAADLVEASYAFGCMQAAGGWKCSLAATSRVTAQKGFSLAGTSNFRRGQRLWAIKKAILPSTAKTSWMTLLATLLRPAQMAETWGQINGPKGLASVNDSLQIEQVACHSDNGVIPFMTFAKRSDGQKKVVKTRPAARRAA